jgi:hypothetical protein
MKVLQVNTVPGGGAGQACRALHDFLNKMNVRSDLLTLIDSETPISNHHLLSYTPPSFYEYYIKRKLSFDWDALYRKNILRENLNNFGLFSLPQTKYNITKQQCYKDADIIHLHWVSNLINHSSFFNTNRKPVIWTLHDMNPFTGGCHYSYDCVNFRNNCSNCPQLVHNPYKDISQKILKLKISAIRRFRDKNKMIIVTPSKWLLELSKTSRVFEGIEHYLINNGFDETVFKIKDRKDTRAKSGLDINK